jgi:hypothetical protein
MGSRKPSRYGSRANAEVQIVESLHYRSHSTDCTVVQARRSGNLVQVNLFNRRICQIKSRRMDLRIGREYRINNPEP